MRIKTLGIADILLIEPKRIADDRGYFAETFRADRLAEATGGDLRFVQDNESLSVHAGTVRGLHFQCDPHAQGKLVRCTAGALFDVVVDIRRGSPTFGQWVGEILSAANGRQLWVPSGFAHGFCTIEAETVICYKVTDYYDASCDRGVAWDDPAIGIRWPDIADAATLSAKDRAQPLLADLPATFDLGEQTSCA